MAHAVQKEKGHSPIAHPIMEALSLAPFSAAQLKVVLHVIRQTYGWSRKDAQIPYGVFCTATGLHKDTVRSAVKKLVADGVLLEVEPATFQRPATYRLQKDPREWGEFRTSPPALTQCDVHHTPGEESHRGVGHTSHTPVGHTSHSDGSQVVDIATASKTLKQVKAKESKKKGGAAAPVASAARSTTDAQKVVNRTIEVGMAGENPADYGKQAKHAAVLLKKQPIDYWLRAAESMPDLFPYSKGQPWDVFDLGRNAAKALAASKTNSARDGPNADPDDDFIAKLQADLV